MHSWINNTDTVSFETDQQLQCLVANHIWKTSVHVLHLHPLVTGIISLAESLFVLFGKDIPDESLKPENNTIPVSVE